MTETSNPLLRKRYRRLELIDRGGMASVYRGRDEALARDVAIKMYPPAVDERDAARQEAEVNVLAGLNHHSLVTLLDAGMDRGHESPRVYLVMEFVSGTNLQQTIAEDPPSPLHISQLGYDIAEGLQYIHAAGVVHRDIKPSNILMVDYGDAGERARAKLTDFGIASYRGSAADDGVTTGTAAYLSPEQVRRSHVGPASDVYSLGLVLLECFTRVLAYPGDAIPSALARLDHQPEVPETLTSDWRAVLAAMTAAEPGDRPSASDLVQLMRGLVIAETGRARRGRPGDRLAPAEIHHDVAADGTFNRVARLASRLLDAPIAIVSVIGADREWSVSVHGIEIDEAVLADRRIATVAGYQFHESARIVTRDGLDHGTVCVVARDPRAITPAGTAVLGDLAGLVADRLEVGADASRRTAV